MNFTKAYNQMFLEITSSKNAYVTYLQKAMSLHFDVLSDITSNTMSKIRDCTKLSYNIKYISLKYYLLKFFWSNNYFKSDFKYICTY